MSIHGSVINLLVGLGYKITEGCCHGFSLRWLEACLLDEEPLFDMRIQTIDSEGDAFKTSHSLTKEIANREAGGIGLARIAAQYNHASVIADLPKQGVDLNKADREGITPAYIAAQNGNVSVIAELGKLAVELNQAMSHGANQKR